MKEFHIKLRSGASRFIFADRYLKREGKYIFICGGTEDVSYSSWDIVSVREVVQAPGL